MTTLAAVMVRGTLSGLPPTGAGVGIAGRTYYATDTGQIWYDSGSAWSNVTPAPTAAAITSIQQKAYTFGTDAGAANAYAVVLTPAPVLVAGSEVVFKAVNANSGPSTLAVNGGTAVAIKKQGTVALAGGEIAAGQIVRLIYDGVNFQM
jgi:hypothetical protein